MLDFQSTLCDSDYVSGRHYVSNKFLKGLSNRKRKIAKSFGDASQSYDLAANIQKKACTLLFDALAERRLLPSENILEIGCGTGNLTKLLLRGFPNSEVLATDISDTMLRKCDHNIAGCKRLNLSLMDGENPQLNGSYDLITSSLAFQWFEDQNNAIRNLQRFLKPQGQILFTTLGQKTFQEWRACHDVVGTDYAGMNYISSHDLIGHQTTFDVKTLYPDSLSFLRVLKSIGATTLSEGRKPYTHRQLKKLLAALDATATSRGVGITYEIILNTVRKNDI